MSIIKEKNLLYRILLESDQAEKEATKLQKSVQGVEGAVKKVNQEAKKTNKETSKELSGLNSAFEKLPGPIGKAATAINNYVKNLNDTKKALDASAAATTGFTRTVRILSTVLKSSGILLAVTALSALASGLARSQDVVDGFTTNLSGLGNAFEKLGDNIVGFIRGEGTGFFDGVVDAFKDTVRLETQLNDLKDKRIKFIQTEADLERQISEFKLDAEDSDAEAFRRFEAQQKVLEEIDKLFKERIELAKEEARIRGELLDITGNLRKEDEELARLAAEVTRLEAQQNDAKLRATRRQAAAQRDLNKQIIEARDGARDILKSFRDLSKTDLELFSEGLDSALGDLEKFIDQSEEAEQQLKKIFEIKGVTISFDDADNAKSLQELQKIITKLRQEAELEAAKKRLELSEELAEAQLQNDVKNERKRQLAIIDSQIAFVEEQIKLELELQKVRQVNTDEDIARALLLEETLKGLRTERQSQALTPIELIFGPGFTLDDFLRSIFTIIDGIKAVANERTKIINDALNLQERVVDRLIRLSEFGADEQVKIEIERLNKIKEEREKAVRQQQQLAAIEIAINQAVATSEILKNIAKQGNPITIALQVAALVAGLAAGGLAIRNAFTEIPAFYEGTEDTGEGGKVDNKGGFKAILHPRERVVPKKYNDQLQGIKNFELPKAVESYRSMPTILSFIDKMDSNLNKGFGDLRSEMTQINQNLKQLNIGMSLDKKGLRTYVLGSGINAKLKRS
jgi:hypothetical protein